MAKKTNNEFIKELKEKNPNITTLEEYKGAIIKILVECKTCKHRWYVTPNSLLSRRTGCPKCSGTYRMTHEEFEQELSTVNPNIILLEKFICKTNKIKVQCKLCGKIWYAFPNNLLRGCGCKSCNIPNKKSHEEFVLEASFKNPYVDIIGTYINNETYIEVRCKHCGEIYNAIPKNVLNGNLHQKCSRIVKPVNKERTRKTHEQFVKDLNEANPNILVTSKYILSSMKIDVQCKICGYNWSAVASSLLRGNGCPCCAKKRVQEFHTCTHEEFVEKLSMINPHIEVIDTYVNNSTKIRIKCKSCGHIEYMTPSKLLSRIYNCKACSDKISFPNRFMTSLLDELHINYIPEKVFDWSNNKRYDFYIPDYNMIIEMHGEQHYTKDMFDKTTKERQEIDNYKQNLAYKNDIKNYLVIDSRISSFDYIWDNTIQYEFFKEKMSIIDKQKLLIKCVTTNRILELASYYNKGITKNVELRKIMGVSKEAVIRYVRKAKQCNLIPA